ncbi:MAG TPA: response regulator [Chryseosolibacter sp.]
MQDQIVLKKSGYFFTGAGAHAMGLKNHTGRNPLIRNWSAKNDAGSIRYNPITTRTFFLIDDDEDDREVFGLALKEVSKEAVCIACKNGKEALARLSDPSLRPDHIFVDINMPLMSGQECLREIRRLPHLRDVPVHMLTTASRVPDEQSYAVMGAQGIYTKPVRMVDLVSMLKTFYTNGGDGGEIST